MESSNLSLNDEDSLNFLKLVQDLNDKLIRSEFDEDELIMMDNFIKSHANQYELMVINYDAPFEKSINSNGSKLNLAYTSLMSNLIDTRLP